MFVFIIVTLGYILQALATEIPILDVESTTEAFSGAPLSPGHAESRASMKPAKSIDVKSTTVPFSGALLSPGLAVESTTGAFSGAPLSPGHAKSQPSMKPAENIDIESTTAAFSGAPLSPRQAVESTTDVFSGAPLSHGPAVESTTEAFSGAPLSPGHAENPASIKPSKNLDRESTTEAFSGAPLSPRQAVESTTDVFSGAPLSPRQAVESTTDVFSGAPLSPRQAVESTTDVFSGAPLSPRQAVESTTDVFSGAPLSHGPAVESTTEAFSGAPLSPGHAENPASLKPSENLDRESTTEAFSGAPLSPRQAVESTTDVFSGAPLSHGPAVESTTEAFSGATLSPGHAENPASIKPSENLDRESTTEAFGGAQLGFGRTNNPASVKPADNLDVESTTEAVSGVPLSPGHAENRASVKPAENLDQISTSQIPTTASTSTPISTTARTFEDKVNVASCAPWFVCEHGKCSDGMSCSCFEGWAGLLCDEPCPENCAPQGTCVTSSSNQAVCVCNDTSMYKSPIGCVEKPSEPPTTTSPTTSTDPNATTAAVAATSTTAVLSSAADDCLGIFTCVHGSCQVMSLACDCHRGWKGQLCDQPCELNCGEHGRCRESDFMQYCECDFPYMGPGCENVPATTIKASTAAPEPVPTITHLDFDINQWFDIGTLHTRDSKDSTNAVAEGTPGATNTAAGSSMDGAATLGPLAQRQCFPGFVCLHGRCAEGEVSCVCDKGWGGILCTLACNLPCGENGTCVVRDGEPAYCQCKPGSGRDCQNHGKGTQVVTTDAHLRVNGSVLSPEGDPWHHLEVNNSRLAPLAQRFCFSGVICAYGNCSKNNNNSVSCMCEPNYTGMLCQYACPLNCGEHGECTYDTANKTALCECHFPYTGSNCTDVIGEDAEESQTTVWMVCLAAVLLLLSLVLLLLLSIWLYKRRNITMMKIVHWFQPFEDDDSKEYDAFVSYCSSDQDRQFVLQTLVPKLEGRMCFTLCIHQRNFVPGQFISDNIVESVKRSRRTLLVVSPSFINSGWCRFEYQMALQEMLNEKHRVLPIIIGDISSIKSGVDGTLKRILRTVTWLEYPSKCSNEQDYDQFWKRLELSMPKKRSHQPELTNAQSCLASPSSALSTEDSKDKDTLPTSYLMANECSDTGLLQSIVRIPADRAAFNDSCIKSNNIALEKIIETRQDKDSQNGTVGSSFVSSTHDLQNSGRSSIKSCTDSCTNSTLDSPVAEASSDIAESSVSNDQIASSDTTSQGSHLHQEVLSNHECSDEEDLPTSMIENYIGNLEIGCPVAV